MPASCPFLADSETASAFQSLRPLFQKRGLSDWAASIEFRARTWLARIRAALASLLLSQAELSAFHPREPRFGGWRCGGRCPPLEIWRGAPPVRADRDASKTTVSATLLPRRRLRDTAPRTIAETTATDERGVNPSLASPRRPNVVRYPDAPPSADYFLTNSARASGASTPPVISTVAKGAACATALLVIMIWPIRFSSCSIDAA